MLEPRSSDSAERISQEEGLCKFPAGIFAEGKLADTQKPSPRPGQNRKVQSVVSGAAPGPSLSPPGLSVMLCDSLPHCLKCACVLLLPSAAHSTPKQNQTELQGCLPGSCAWWTKSLSGLRFRVHVSSTHWTAWNWVKRVTCVRGWRKAYERPFLLKAIPISVVSVRFPFYMSPYNPLVFLWWGSLFCIQPVCVFIPRWLEPHLSCWLWFL